MLHDSIDATPSNFLVRTLFAPKPAPVLDVGAGSGRDAAWLVSHGHQRICVFESISYTRKRRTSAVPGADRIANSKVGAAQLRQASVAAN